MSTPSLLNIPYVIKAGTLYSQIPETGAGDFVVTRSASNAATRINSLGFIETVSDNIPRLDYPLGGAVNGCPALLVEPAATNLARWVNQMTAQDTPAASGGMTVTTGSTDFLAPDGTSGSITKYVGGAASGTSQYAYYTGGQVTASASGVHTFSLFVKRGATNPLNFCALGIGNYDGGSGTTYSYFNLASGTALTAGASVQNYGNGWYRLTTAPYTLAAGDLNGTLLFFMAEGNGDRSWPASGALNLTAYTWGAQFEAGSVATSYIPTTTAAVTRGADVISKTGVGSLIGQTEGTIYVDAFIPKIASVFVVAIGSSGGIGEAVYLEVASNLDLRARIRSASTAVDLTISAANWSAGLNKAAFTYGSGNCSLVLNGGSPVTGTVTFVPTCDRVVLGSRVDVPGTLSLTNRIRPTALYTTRLTNAQLQALTT